MKVLLSIKPEFVEKIFSGEKRYEFRRAIFKKPQVSIVVVYASTPIQKVVGEFTISEILYDNVNSLWLRTRRQSGITKDLFLKYFENKNHGFAIGISRVRRYRSPLSLRKDFRMLPPQSYAYLS
jgi:predicted transcriptional regulator